MPHRLIPAAAMLAAALAPGAALGQTEVRTSPQPNYNLVQLSVNSAEVAPEEFKTRTAAIRSCQEALQLAGDLGAEVTRNPYVRADQLPSELKAILKDLPAGQATPVFSGNGEVLRVLVVCNRS
jgi:hypothetical protein